MHVRGGQLGAGAPTTGAVPNAHGIDPPQPPTIPEPFPPPGEADPPQPARIPEPSPPPGEADPPQPARIPEPGPLPGDADPPQPEGRSDSITPPARSSAR